MRAYISVDMEGIAGVHLIAHRHEELVPEILHESGLTRERDAASSRPVPGVI